MYWVVPRPGGVVVFLVVVVFRLGIQENYEDLRERVPWNPDPGVLGRVHRLSRRVGVARTVLPVPRVVRLHRPPGSSRVLVLRPDPEPSGATEEEVTVGDLVGQPVPKTFRVPGVPGCLVVLPRGRPTLPVQSGPVSVYRVLSTPVVRYLLRLAPPTQPPDRLPRLPSRVGGQHDVLRVVVVSVVRPVLLVQSTALQVVLRHPVPHLAHPPRARGRVVVVVLG